MSEPPSRDHAVQQRLEALRELGILDTPAEVEFDDVVLLASTLCDSPVALISLVAEDRQWFKARVGFPLLQTDLDHSVCKYALTKADLLIIPDLRLDPRTAGNPLVTGEPFIRFYAGAPLRDGNGVPIGSLCVIDTEPRPTGLTEAQAKGLRVLGRHVTALLEARWAVRQFILQKESDLAVTRAELTAERRTAELREQYAAVLSHDLRNPLAAIDAGLRLVARAPSSDRASEVLSMMKLSVARMAELIENTLDLTRTRRGRGLGIRSTTDVPLSPVLEQVVAEVRSASPECRIDTSIELTAPVPCDPDRIGQMISNLLSNAVTHGDGTQPIIFTARTANNLLTLSVANGGSAIPPAILERIFQPFAQGVASEGQGLGLGLYIAAEIARAHKGTLGVTSTPEQTCFVFQMPLS